jgi:hypothetical protein
LLGLTIAVSLLCATTISIVALLCNAPNRDAVEEAKLAAAYVRLRDAIEKREYEVAYSLMSARYQAGEPLSAFEASFDAVRNYFPMLRSNSIIRVDQNMGEVRIPMGGDEFWAQYWFINENGQWHFTGQQGVWTRGWP